MDPIGLPVGASAVRVSVDAGHGLALFGDGWCRVTRMTVEDARYLRPLRDVPIRLIAQRPPRRRNPRDKGIVPILAPVNHGRPAHHGLRKAQVSPLAVGRARDVRLKDNRFGDT